MPNPTSSGRPSLVEQVSWHTGIARDVVKRRQLPLEDLATHDEVLNVAYTYWDSKRSQGLLPSRTEIDVLEITKLIRHTHLVDVHDPDPKQWCFRIVSSIIPPSWQWGRNKDKLSDCPWPAYKEMLIQDYSAVKQTGVPMYHELAIRIEWVAYRYARVLLPLAADGRQVDTLMSCVFHRSTPALQI